MQICTVCSPVYDTQNYIWFHLHSPKKHNETHVYLYYTYNYCCRRQNHVVHYTRHIENGQTAKSNSQQIHPRFVFYLNQGCTNPKGHVAQATTSCTMTPNVCGFSVWNVLLVNFLLPRILMCLLDFCKFVQPLSQRKFR
jgi:hypothetical protein